MRSSIPTSEECTTLRETWRRWNFDSTILLTLCRFWGTQEGRDGYDLIEHIATLDWCNGKIGMAGNSWLAIGMWFIAAERPPHLTCIAPFEGPTDLYMEHLCRGGVPQTPFAEFISKGLRGMYCFGYTFISDNMIIRSQQTRGCRGNDKGIPTIQCILGRQES